MKFSEAIAELRTSAEKRNFEQTLDLIINLKDFDLKKDHLNAVIILPFSYKKKKVAAFLEDATMAEDVDKVILKNEIEGMAEPDVRRLSREFDFFIANAKLMPLIAKSLGKSLGSAGKMPDPALGAVFPVENRKAIADIVQRLQKTVRVRAKESSLKIAIGKETMPSEQIEQNASAVLASVIKGLPKADQNIKSVMLKFTMSHPVKVKMEDKIAKERGKKK
ncbi:MAG: hypothetical protein WC475_04465 [Candidatus Paceibacterota bacterium]